MVEWSITPVLKTGVLRGTGGSNPSLSAKAIKLDVRMLIQFFVAYGHQACLSEHERRKNNLHVSASFIAFAWTPAGAPGMHEVNPSFLRVCRLALHVQLFIVE